MGKNIKKIYKILIIFLLVLLAIPTTAFFILQNKHVQTYLTQRIAEEISENLEAKIEVESVSFRFFNKVVLNNVYLEDQLKDTLFYSGEMICNLSKLDRKEKIIDIKNIDLHNARIYLHKFDTLLPINLKFSDDTIKWQDSIPKIDSTIKNKKWQVSFKNIEMHESIFWYKSVRKREKPEGVINFNDLVCYIEDLDVRDLKVENGVVDFYAKKLKFKEKNGFDAYNVKFNMSIGKQHMIFRNVKIRTPYSYINSDSLVFRHKNYKVYQQFAKNIYLDFAFQESNLSLIDLGYFVGIFKGYDINTVISGRVYSKLSTFKGKDVAFKIGEQSELITDFNLNGLPNHHEMFMYIDFKKFTSYASDFHIINSFLKKNKGISIPESFDKLGILNYKGSFAGFYDDFVTYGKLTSNLGDISTDISLKPDTSQTLSFNGQLSTDDFNVGELFPQTERIGVLSMSANINGSINTKKEITAITKGTVQNIQINDYNYQNIEIDGLLTEKTYDGSVNISDPNIQLNFEGGIDYSQEMPKYNFIASVPYTDLYGLNIDRNDTSAQLSFDVIANFEGNSIDNAIGAIEFNNTDLRKLNTNMVFDTLNLISEHFADTQKIELKSDYIDVLLKGAFKSSTLLQSLKNLYFNYLPNLIDNPGDTIQLDYNNHFTLDIDFKDTYLISQFFIPNVYLADNSSFNFNYDAKANSLKLNAITNQLKYDNQTFNNLGINAFSNDSIFTAFTKCESFLLNNYFELGNFKTTSLTHRNNIDFKIDWQNNDTTNYNGKILASASISQKVPFGNPAYTFTILPSQVVVSDSLWYINKSQIKIDTTSINFNQFKINHGNQHFAINGKVSEIPTDTLFFEFEDLNLSHLNIITREKKLNFEGIINGKANFSSILNNPLFYSDIQIDNLVLNNEEFGHTQIYSRWIESTKAIQLEASTAINEKRPINISGNYYPEEKNIMFNIVLDKLGLNALNPYLGGFASNIAGICDGTVLVTGFLDKPEFNGSLFMHDAAMTIDYINTRYNFSTEVIVEKNSLVFKDVDSFDPYENKGITNGFVKFGPGKNINFDFNINAQEVLALNTTHLDNESFFGTAYMTGLVKIIGDRESTLLDISARTEKDTKISIPLTRFQDSEQGNFITFVNKNERAENETTEFRNTYSGFRLNFDLEVTPDAEALLIFDSKIGDIIRSTGEGDIKMEINDDNDFKMYGDFNIEDGDYLFTLQNVINKKFKIERGGSIVWNGEPNIANIDIEAIYNLRTSLSTLIDSTSYYSSEDFRKRIPVDCEIYLSNMLLNPDIRFDINLPTADEEAKTILRNATNTEEKLNKQFLSLLVLNSFIREQTGNVNSASTTNSAGIGTVTTSELLSNQLSHWLSQISDEWDLGVNYRPGDEITRDQVEVALSTQIFDDRVSIDGNVGYGGQTIDEASNIVGDVNIEVKLNKSGKLRLRAFNESNDKQIYENAPYTQGVGIFYREEFSSFSELMNKFWNKFRKKKDDSVSD